MTQMIYQCAQCNFNIHDICLLKRQILFQFLFVYFPFELNLSSLLLNHMCYYGSLFVYFRGNFHFNFFPFWEKLICFVKFINQFSNLLHSNAVHEFILKSCFITTIKDESRECLGWVTIMGNTLSIIWLRMLAFTWCRIFIWWKGLR